MISEYFLIIVLFWVTITFHMLNMKYQELQGFWFCFKYIPVGNQHILAFLIAVFFNIDKEYL